MQGESSSDTVLVVDDDPEWRVFVTDALASSYAVVSVSTGSEGVRIARTTSPCAIVLDVLMAGAEDGFMILCELRKDPATRLDRLLGVLGPCNRLDQARELLKQSDSAKSLYPARQNRTTTGQRETRPVGNAPREE